MIDVAEPPDPVMAFLQSSNLPAQFCSQNGWFMSESMTYEVLHQTENKCLIYITFMESIMEGSGCQCDQKSCYGRMELVFDENNGAISGCTIT
jgi:hypothetical protein